LPLHFDLRQIGFLFFPWKPVVRDPPQLNTFFILALFGQRPFSFLADLRHFGLDLPLQYANSLCQSVYMTHRHFFSLHPISPFYLIVLFSLHALVNRPLDLFFTSSRARLADPPPPGASLYPDDLVSLLITHPRALIQDSLASFPSRCSFLSDSHEYCGALFCADCAV